MSKSLCGCGGFKPNLVFSFGQAEQLYCHIFADSTTMIVKDDRDSFTDFLDEVAALESLNLSSNQDNLFPLVQAEDTQLSIKVELFLSYDMLYAIC